MYRNQIFPQGCIQILGNHSEAVYSRVHTFLTTLLSPLTLTPPKVKSCTVMCYWKGSQHLNTISSNAHVSNDRELFPGLLIAHPRTIHQRTRHYHCSLFPNGRAIVTGVTSIPEAKKTF